MKKYKHLLIDLDSTLWDFEQNAKKTLNDIYDEFNLEEKIPLFELFYKKYKFHNNKLWAKYRAGLINKNYVSIQRFYLTLSDFKINKIGLSKKISKRYLDILATKTMLMPYALEILEYLKPKYEMSILTNGFKEVQQEKMKNSGLEKYFKFIITSEEATALKPNAKIFNYALNKTNVQPSECLMIGDDFEIDIMGAKQVGIDQIYYNPKMKKILSKATYTINSLREIEKIL